MFHDRVSCTRPPRTIAGMVWSQQKIFEDAPVVCVMDTGKPSWAAKLSQMLDVSATHMKPYLRSQTSHGQACTDQHMQSVMHSCRTSRHPKLIALT